MISSITTIATGLAVADPVVVAWQIDDVGTFPSEYVKSLVARYSIPSPASTSTPTINALEPTTAPTSNGLSTGTRVGIGVGVALAAALAGGLLIFWCLRRRRKAGGTEGPDAVISEMEDQDHTHTERKWYFGGRWRSEVDAKRLKTSLTRRRCMLSLDHRLNWKHMSLRLNVPRLQETMTAELLSGYNCTQHSTESDLEKIFLALSTSKEPEHGNEYYMTSFLLV